MDDFGGSSENPKEDFRQQEPDPNTGANPDPNANSDPNGNPGTNAYGAQPNQGYPYSDGRPGGGYYGSGYSGSPYGYSRNNGYVYYGNAPQGRGQPPYGEAQRPPVKKKPSKHKKGGLIAFITAIVLCFAVGVTAIIGALTGRFAANKDTLRARHSESNLETRPTPEVPMKTSGGELTAAGVYNKVKESSVGVIVYSGTRFSSAVGEGSGVIVGENPEGTQTYIITAAHVIRGGLNVHIQLFDETRHEAQIVGYDAKTDVGVLRIGKTGFQAAEFGDSDSVVVGESVYAIGNPGGTAFAGSFTDGIVSAIARPVDSEIGYEMLCIQHTAAINPGNSGGALLNAQGQVIGINSSKIAGTGYEGMGFSVPSRTVKEVFDEIVANGYVTNRPKLGITYTPTSASQIYSMIVSLKGLPAGSLIIQGVSEDSSLAREDVQKDDLIIKANGHPLNTADDLPDLIESSNVGDKITLTICRIDSSYNVSEFEVTATLVEDKSGMVKPPIAPRRVP